MLRIVSPLGLHAFRSTAPAIGLIAILAVSDAHCGDVVTLPAVRSELISRARVDQDLRMGLGMSAPPSRVDWQRIGLVDHANTTRIRQLVAKHGWLTRAMVGPDGAAAAWLLVQHADDDSAFQARCLRLIEALPQDEVPGEARALLTDRVLLAQGAKQRFGSQFEVDCDGGFKPKPIEDPDHVDERRVKYGMQPLAEYLDSAKSILCTTQDGR